MANNQNQGSSKKLGVITLICVIAILIIVGVILVMMLTGNTDEPPTQTDGESNTESSGGDNGAEDESSSDSETEPNEDIMLWLDEFIYSREGDTVLFGSYPQTQVTDEDILSTLSKKQGTLPTEGDESSDGWVSYGYFTTVTHPEYGYNYVNNGNFMWYKDVVSGGEMYRGVYFTAYRSFDVSGSDQSSGSSNQDENGYAPSNVYWFKYEPISWTVISESDEAAIIICDMAIDAQQYDYGYDDEQDRSKDFRGRYDQSTVREWLNATFYETAFNPLQKAMIELTLVDNSLATQGTSNVPAGIGENTEDKVFLLANEEFDSYFASATGVRSATDYAKAQGLPTDTTKPGDICWWWLRSGHNQWYDYAQSIGFDGKVSWSKNDYVTYLNGIVPVLQINLIED